MDLDEGFDEPWPTLIGLVVLGICTWAGSHLVGGSQGLWLGLAIGLALGSLARFIARHTHPLEWLIGLFPWW